MLEPETITHYHKSPSRDVSYRPADAGRAEDIVRCVASLFQKGSISEICLKSTHVLITTGKGYTYEVKFLRGPRTLKRRFTLYRLGGIHSKSECYQVTDPKGTYMVVKVPPHPVTDMNAYLMAITHERRLAQKLFALGIRVVVPCVGSVMKHLHKLNFAQNMSPCEMEQAYLDVLQISGSIFSEHFKIGDRYVFFMEYLDEPFLGKIVREFYNKDMLANLKREYFERDLILLTNHDRIGFMCEYKHIGAMKYLYEIYSDLQETFAIFCEKIDSISDLFSTSLSLAKKKDWFIARSLEKLIDDSSFLEHWHSDYGDKDLIVKRLNALINKPGVYSEIFKHYLNILDQEVHWSAFRYGANKMKLIGNNLLALLVMLEEMGLVLRDLKVDNIFISDDVIMELGIIDLETGGYVGSGRVEGIVPAGMPSNMTLSNLLFVSQIKRIYGDEKVTAILHMQDWYATISMMFETNIGATLFEDARNYILKINREIDERLTKKHNDFVRNNPGARVTPDMIELFFSLSDEEIQGHTWQFWNLARQDLKRQSLKHKTKLLQIEYDLPPELKRRFLSDIELELQQIQGKYRSYKMTAASIDYFNKKTTTIVVLQKNLALKELLYSIKKNQQSSKYKTKVKLAQEIDIYKACIIQKQKEEDLQAKKKILNQDHISAFDLFPIMLHLIIKEMCQEKWFKLSPEALCRSKGKIYSTNQSIIPTESWKPTIIPSIEELEQRRNDQTV